MYSRFFILPEFKNFVIFLSLQEYRYNIRASKIKVNPPFSSASGLSSFSLSSRLKETAHFSMPVSLTHPKHNSDSQQIKKWNKNILLFI